MAEYLKKDKAIDIFIEGDGDDEFTEGYNFAVNEYREKIRAIPATEVQPVKHGRWIPQGDDMWLCSNCKENIIYSEHESDRTEKQRYCSRCGARMDLKDGETK